MVWQFVVLPGGQIVTLTYGMLKVASDPTPEGPASTVIETTLAAAEAMVWLPVPVPVPVEPEPPARSLPLPPQADRKMSWIKANKKILRTGSLVT
jgi:hypothetical protein